MARPVDFLLKSCALAMLATVSFSCMPHDMPPAPHKRMFKPAPPPAPESQSDEDVQQKSSGCLKCHTQTDAPSMHASPAVKLGCTDCHGGDASAEDKEKAHVMPHDEHHFHSSANPHGNPAALNKEPWDFVRFINPADLRVADLSCGSCHGKEVAKVRKSMMTHGGMLWNAALYNNGSFPRKHSHFGESYSREGLPQRLQTVPPPTPEETRTKGVLPFLNPLPRFEIGQPSNILRVFERGGRRPIEVGIINQPLPPDQDEEPGRPEQNRLSPRGYGTNNRTDPVWLNLMRTRLLDPTLNFLGTNDSAGEYRSSGCSACHVLYANDTDAMHSGSIASAGKEGRTQTVDPVIPKDESGHPIKHVFTRAIPSSQCIVCHIHPGTTVTCTYLGYTWWDNETHGDLLYPKEEVKPDLQGKLEAKRLTSNPEGSAMRGLWGDPEFLKNVSTLNDKMKDRLNPMKFAEFNGHGWIFRAVYKKDIHGNLLDANDNKIAHDDSQKMAKAVHLRDIHLEKGMHCIDCHFEQDAHGNEKLYGSVRDAVEIDCIDCHGTIDNKANLRTTGSAAVEGGRDLSTLQTPFGKRRFQWRGERLLQRSMVTEDLEWELVQTRDTVTPGNPNYNELSALAKTMQKDGRLWGDPTVEESKLAHGDSSMTCFACHTSWVTSCYGCHLPMKANRRREFLHYESTRTRNWTSYNFMTLRDEIFMLGRDSTVQRGRISPTRSMCAVIVGSQNANREWVYSQQQTISAEGFSGQSFATHVPHTVRGKESKNCTDCHVSEAGDTNALMAQLMMQGTNAMNFMSRYIYVAEGDAGVEGVVVTEADEPQAVIGSTLHQHAYPEQYAKHLARGSKLTTAYGHYAGGPFQFTEGGDITSLQQRGEYLYCASGRRGLQIFDIANIDNKGFSQRITSAPVSPLMGQRLWVNTTSAAWVASPTTLGVDPTRPRIKENEEGPIHMIYAFLYVADRYEGLILVGAGTILDGDPRNNFVERALTFNPDGKLTGAHYVTIVGTYAYVLTEQALVVVDLNDPQNPKLAGEVGAPALDRPRAIAVQFRYAFVADAAGLKVLDVTDLAQPKAVEGAAVPLEDGAWSVYVSRTYALVAARAKGLAIIDVEKPEKPALVQLFSADGALNDTHDAKVGVTNACFFAYVADGRNGLRVIQLISPEKTPGYAGFSPPLTPELIATYRTKGPALAISEGVDRDRAVDESGNQLAVFNRVGSRPFNLQDMQKLYLREGKVYAVKNTAPGEALKFTPKEEEKEEGEKKPGRRPRPRK